MRWGIRAIIGRSFAEIFFGNCLALGIPCLTAPKKAIEELQGYNEVLSNKEWDIEMIQQKLLILGKEFSLDIDPSAKEMLISGKWDSTAQLVRQNDNVVTKLKTLPYLNGFIISKNLNT